MSRTSKVALLAMTLSVALGFAGQASAADKINVLIIDGQNNHAWKATTPVIKKILEDTGKFTVDVLTSPPEAEAPKNATEEQKKAFEAAHKEAWAKFKPDFSKYQALFINYNDFKKGASAWPEEVNKNLETYIKNGGGMVVYHAANNAFVKTGWTEWHKMIGLLWGDAKFGEHVALDKDGKEVRLAKGEGGGAGHGPAHPYQCDVRDAEHPVTKGMPAKWMHAKDELYQNQRGPAENMHIIVTAFADPQFKGNGLNEPIAWSVSYGKGKVFVCVLGHDATNTAAPGCALLYARGTEWVATGKVTIPVPADINSAAAEEPKKADAKK